MTYRFVLPAALAAALIAVPIAHAQDSGVTGDNPANPTLATVNGLEVTAADVAFAMETLGDALQRVPEPNRPQVALDLMVDMHVLADAAEKKGMADDPQFQQRLEAYRMQTLRDLYMAQIVEETISDEAVRARYDEEVGKLEPREEISARHILVEDEARAKELIAELEGGADFAELAEANSTDPGSAAQGGSLGYFGRGQMVPAFEEAAFGLEPGAVTSEPVQSQFGYHIIKLEDRRTAEPPAFEQVSSQIRQMMIRDAFMNELNTLKADATITYAARETSGEAPEGTNGEADAASPEASQTPAAAPAGDAAPADEGETPAE